MSFDKETRNLLAKTITTCRRRLTEDVTDQLQSVFGLHPDGTVLPLDRLEHLTMNQVAAARKLRELLDHYTAGESGAVEDRKKAAYNRLVLEASFTILNRLAALRLCEERELIIESVRKGTASDGFRIFERVSGNALGTRYKAYRVFLECMFDELAVDLGGLFDRFSPQSAVFPSERCLEDVLTELNKPELTHLWTEDETIGWVYQYFNPPEERKAMRDASSAPRNSRELAVRNQFFTPRYVVEFLTDNTLGRIWYEMRKGDTVLKEECRYLVRRPNEIFMESGEQAPEVGENDTDLSQEELLKKPVYIEHRPKKDPRDLKILDPACGSGHFLLYAFDLLERIYEEAWDDPESPKSEAMGHTLRQDFETLDELRRAVPKLIIEHNLHGIDIDPRSVQIAALALWLRSQKTWRNLGIKASERPKVAKSNIVTAEPMPGEEDMRREFTAGLKPRVLGQLVDVVFDKMKLAGEAGSLLRIEEEIKDAVTEAREQWLKGPKMEQGLLFSDMEAKQVRQLELQFDVRGVTDEGFWEQAEDRILDALKDYAERAENGRGIRRRLFAGDAARGFAFIDLCRKRYDVVLMNPPFGSPAAKLEDARKDYPNCGRDIYAMFVERMGSLRNSRGLIGAIQPRTGLFIGTMKELRKHCYLESIPLFMLADLGKGVLDEATVRTACYVFGISYSANTMFMRVGNIENREEKLLELTRNLKAGVSDKDTFIRLRSHFLRMPGIAIAYWIPSRLVNILDSLPRLGSVVDIRQGIATGDNFRFLRLFHELPCKHSEYRWYSKGGDPVPFISDEGLYVKASDSCREMKANAAQKYGSASRTIKNEDTFGRRGITYSQVNDACLKFRIHPSGGLYDMKGPVLFASKKDDLGYLLSFLNTSAVEDFMRMMTDGRQWHVSALKQVPFPPFDCTDRATLSAHARTSTVIRRNTYKVDETSHVFAIKEALRCGTVSHVVKTWEQEVEDIVWRLYGADEQDICSLQRQRLLFLERDVSPSSKDDNRQNGIPSIAVGFTFGRWDIRIALDPSLTPKLPDPFDPLPVCPPGMLVGPDGLPVESGRIGSEEWLRARLDANTFPAEDEVKKPIIPDSDYPLRISWDGILVDDLGFNGAQPHRDDIVRRIREVLDLLWKDRAHEIEQEACDILGVSDLRDYFRKPSEFFQDHLKRYSKSRRKAPIYWPLSTASGSYSLWIYYHRLTDQTLYTAVNKYLEPKIAEVKRNIARVEKDLESASGLEATRLRDRLDEIRSFLAELRDFREELLRIAALPYKPNLNDGVIINASPFHKLFRLRSWAKDTENVWKKLEKGDYDWAHLAYAIWPERVREICKKDRSIAIAHGLEDICEVKSKPAKKKRRGKKKTEETGLLTGAKSKKSKAKEQGKEKKKAKRSGKKA